ncbi:AAA family ATPase [Streptomyces sp. NPDC028722]|uniref:AAA family ATPase n=1 Tax=Streptomyces sp. NPDC028722 TaxID=3155016 RepID=UPI0033FCB632
MTSITVTRPASEAQVVRQVETTPLPAAWIHTREGWNRYVRSELEPPALEDCPPAPPVGTEVDEDDPRVVYHSHLLMVSTPFITGCLLQARRTFGLNGSRLEGLQDLVIDGPEKTGKTFLLRAIGRDFQRRIEQRFAGHIPVVHITAPHDPDSKLNWVWEIASFLALTPEPKNEQDARQLRRPPDLSLAVHTVMERMQTRMLLVDDIQRVSPEQLGPVLHYFDYLRARLGIATIFCGTGAADIVHAARTGIDRRNQALWSAHQRLNPSGAATQVKEAVASERKLRSLLPVTWVDPLPYSEDNQEPLLIVLKGFEQNLRLRNPSPDVLTRNAPYLYKRTGGYLFYLSQLICRAATDAIFDGTEDITFEHLEAIRVGREEILPQH